MTYPKERLANLAMRQDIAKATGSARKAILARCKTDLLYWVNTCCYIAEQRAVGGHVILPFITYDFQDDALKRMQRAVTEQKIVVIDKSRDEGVSYCVLAYGLYEWLFMDYCALGFASRTEKLVESPNNPDCLFWKFDFMLDNLPSWMIPKGIVRSRLNRYNPDTKGNITGYATSKDIARGGRRRWIFLDEHGAYDYKEGHGAWASCESATNTIISVSTHQGMVGKFADACKSAKEHPDAYEYIQIRWYMDQRKNEGLTTVDPASPVAGMSQWTLDNRAGQPWSPWYEWKCKRLGYDKKRIAEEVDGDPSGAGGGFFSQPLLDFAKKSCRPPRHVGRLVYDRETCEPIKFVEDPNGNLSLWCNLQGGQPVLDEYACGTDISSGQGSTPSVLSIGSMRTGEQVAEYADSKKPPIQFVRDAMAICKWFHNAQIIWETAGPGGIFSRGLRDGGYRYLYYRRTNEGDLAPLPTAHIGWSPSYQTTLEVLEDLRDALGSGQFVPRSEEMLKECPMYTYSPLGYVEQEKAKKTEDTTKAKQQHGDRVIAAALLWKLIKEGGRTALEPGERALAQDAQPGSVAWFLEQDERAAKEAEAHGGLNL